MDALGEGTEGTDSYYCRAFLKLPYLLSNKKEKKERVAFGKYGRSAGKIEAEAEKGNWERKSIFAPDLRRG